jgi:hypothetical protein
MQSYCRIIQFTASIIHKFLVFLILLHIGSEEPQCVTKIDLAKEFIFIFVKIVSFLIVSHID